MSCNLKKNPCARLHCRVCPKDNARHKIKGQIHCDNHSCPAEGSACTNPKGVNDRYCFKHTQCRSCPDRARPADQVFCPTHECSNASCHNPRTAHWDQCGQHVPRCQYNRQCHETDLGGTKFCAAHRCNKERCSNKAAEPRGGCCFHVPCIEEGCDRIRAERAGGGFETHCYLHVCNTCGSCGKQVAANETYCLAHACGFRGCQLLASQEFHSQFCVSHTCSTTACGNSVSNLRDANSKHCHQHECAERGCANEAKTPGGFCTTSHACSNPACPKRRALSREVGEVVRFCASHECAEPTCHAEAPQAGRYCAASHACLAAASAGGDCPGRRTATAHARYCAAHECRNSRCAAAAREDGGLCAEQHACGVKGCPAPRSGLSFCGAHACAADGCSEPAPSEATRFCARDHACATAAGCSHRRSTQPANTRFCTVHKCQKETCDAEARASKGFCANHGCTRDGCGDARYDKRDNPKGLCTEHLLDAKAEKPGGKVKKSSPDPANADEKTDGAKQKPAPKPQAQPQQSVQTSFGTPTPDVLPVHTLLGSPTQNHWPQDFAMMLIPRSWLVGSPFRRSSRGGHEEDAPAPAAKSQESGRSLTWSSFRDRKKTRSDHD